MKTKLQFSLLLLVLALPFFLTGCFDSDSKSSGPVVPGSYVTLKGSITAPDQVESSLLASVLNNVDSDVRNAFRTAIVYVNGSAVASYTIDSSTGTSWPIRLYNVPEIPTGKYNIQIIAGKIALKSNILAAEKDNFAVNIETTAAAILAEAMNKEQQQMLASYPAIVNSLKADLIAAALKTATELGGNLAKIGTDAVTNKYKAYLTAIGDLNSTAKIAYIQDKNDLDGDGIIDLQIVQVGGGQRIRFFTTLATATSLFENAAGLASYTDAKLLQDFASSLTSESNSFAAADKDFVLGLFFKRSAVADQYLKLLVRRIDLNAEGVFKGVVAEYSYISTSTTAVTRGTKTLMLQNGSPVEGAVLATDFINDGVPTDNNLAYINTQSGIGCYSGNQLLVALIDGQPELEKLSSAPKTSTGVYFANTTAALNDLKPGRTLAVGDVFAAWLPAGKNYAVFKIKQIDASSITVDFKVNSTANEPRF